MDHSAPLRLKPTLSMICDSLARSGIHARLYLTDPGQQYQGIRLYHRKQTLQKDILYLLRPTERNFPFDTYSYLTTGDLRGRGNHLICPAVPDEELLDLLLEIFSRYRDWEDAIDLLVYRGAGMQELCDLGAEILENPVCIHDDWFVMMAMTKEFSTFMEPEYIMSSTRSFIPRAVVEDFENDDDYLETYSHRTAQLRQSPDSNQTSLYVNLWDGPVYKGRLLVARKNRDFTEQDFLVAEVLTQRAVQLLRRKQLGEAGHNLNMDDTVFALLQGRTADPAALTHLLNQLHWQRSHQFLCLRLKPLQTATAMAEHMLHSDLFRSFPDSYILLDSREQCILTDLTVSPLDPGRIHQLLDSLCRDYGLCVGISAPVSGILESNVAYYQAGCALDQSFRPGNYGGILFFSECVMDHITRILPPPLTREHLISPDLKVLIRTDQEKGTQYFDTLRAYLLQERDIPRTSEALIIHRTTLLYRLKKIESLIHTNLDDPWQRLYLTLSLWLLEQEPLA